MSVITYIKINKKYIRFYCIVPQSITGKLYRILFVLESHILNITNFMTIPDFVIAS